MLSGMTPFESVVTCGKLVQASRSWTHWPVVRFQVKPRLVLPLGEVAELRTKPLRQVAIGRTKIALSYADGRFGAIDALQAACAHYAQLGYRVFPCIPGGKAPLTPHGFQDASADAPADVPIIPPYGHAPLPTSEVWV